METAAPGTVIPIPGAPNLRDLGGWAVAGGGTVRRGLVYRSAELNGLAGPGAEQFARLGIRTVFDLRTGAERSAQPDHLPEGVADVHLDVLADAPGNPAAHAADLPKLLADPATAEQMLAGVDLVDVFGAAYRQVVTLPSAIASYRALYGSVARERHRPALFHCTTGKDRTGWGAAALLSLLGVDHDDVVADYLLTNTEILPLTQPMYDEFQAAGGDPALLRPALGVEEQYLQTAFDEMRKTFGSIERYFTEGLGLDVATIGALRSALVA